MGTIIRKQIGGRYAHRRPVVLLALLSICALGASSAVPPRDGRGVLRTVESAEGGFRAQLPEPLPVPERKSRPTLLGPVHEVHYAVPWDDAHVSVELYDIPRLATLIFPTAVLLDQAADGVVAEMQARELARSSLSRQQHPARVVTYELPGAPTAVERALIVLAGSRLYVVVVTSPPGDGLGPSLEQIVDSFEIVGR